MKRFTFGLTFASTVFSVNVFAEEECSSDITDNCACQPNIIAFPNNTVDGPKGKIPIVLEADNVESEGDKSVTLSGDAFVAQGRQSISANKITYSKETDKATGEGGVTLRSIAGDVITADSIDLDVNTEIGSAKNAQFKLAERGLIEEETNAVLVQSRGSAKELSVEGEEFVRLKNVEYTTCVEGQDDYFLRAKDLELDQATGIGRAKSATIVFKGVPILYAPTFSFPITDERKSGFLFPSVGFNSDSGAIFATPWYWNIAPNADATITPRLYTNRGVQLGIQARHLTDYSETFFYGEVMPGDSEFEDESRSMITLQHDQDITERLSAEIDFNDVSDRDYFTDFSTDINAFSATYIPRKASLTYNANYWNASARVSAYELVDDDVNENNQPFERRPELSFNSNFPKTGIFQFDIDASASNFSGSRSTDTVSTTNGTTTTSTSVEQGGWRYLFNPGVEVPMENVWGYLTPRLELDYAGFSLDDVETESRSVPVLSVDSGIYLEKRSNFLGSSSIQTLEPRVFFVYAGDVEQDETPLFDSRELRFNNFNNLFSTSSFTGGDRAADNRQVTLALTSRIFDEDGQQRFKASIGQAYYLEDREVTVDDETTTVSRSDLLAEATVDFGNNWELDTFVQYDAQDSDFNTLRVSGEYRESDKKHLSLSYLKSQVGTSIEQIVVQGELPLSDHLSIFGAERYSIEDSENLQTQLGFEYDACCWRLRVYADSLRSTDDEDRKSVFAEFELTGLGRVRGGAGLGL